MQPQKFDYSGEIIHYCSMVVDAIPYLSVGYKEKTFRYLKALLGKVGARGLEPPNLTDVNRAL